jgi:cysteine desulfurase
MRPYLTEHFGNPSSAHAIGRKTRQALEDARERLATLLGAFPDEVIFTSGATESNNLALFGLAGDPPGHILASRIEHPSVVEPLEQLERRGFEVEWLPVMEDGRVCVDAIRDRPRQETRLLTLMMTNHETGAWQSVRDAASQFPGVAFHSDAAQAAGKVPIASFHELGIASLAGSGHKIGAPKGVGFLLLKRGTFLQSLMFGGHQQQGRRPGTEPVAMIVGLAKALEIAHQRMTESAEHARRLHRLFVDKLRQAASPIRINSPTSGSPYVVNVSFPGCRADLLLIKLDLAGVACSTGSACSSGSLLPSPVLQAMGVSDEYLRSAMRFSFSATTSEEDIIEAANCIINSANDLRRQ